MSAVGSPSESLALASAQAVDPAKPPLWLLAELTYQCPLHCVFCSNPVDYTRQSRELTTDEWKTVFRQAREMGSVQLGFSGGEPLLRPDLEELVAEAASLGFYTNLITSGIGLTEARAKALKDAGLAHVQISFQDSSRELNDFLSSTRTFEHKRRVAKVLKDLGYPMVLNCVLHRYNLPHIARIIEMAHDIGAEFVELANTQYYGWAWINRDALMPTPEELKAAEAVANHYKERYAGQMKIFWVPADYVEGKPKPCMAGWGSIFMIVSPDGQVLPCHAARILPGLSFPKVPEVTLHDAWFKSEAFNKYRGTAWLPEGCLSCAEHTKDFGGCRCQAYLLTGDADIADPVCHKSEHRDLVQAALDATRPIGEAAQVLRFVPNAARQGELVFRTDANSRALGDLAVRSLVQGGAAQAAVDVIKPPRG